MGGRSAGVHFALPTMATTDAAHKRVDKWAKKALAASSPVTLAHGQAGWNRSASPVLTHAQEVSTAAPTWLFGHGRSVLAAVTVSTIDQVLTAVLRVRHNVLRLGGLTRKILLVDECHAYDPYQQTLLRRALAWWGRLGMPVVLMSATLPGAVARSLAQAYLSGSAPGVAAEEIQPAYPGWFYMDGSTGEVKVSEPIVSDRPRTLDIDLVALPGLSRPIASGKAPEADQARAAVVSKLMASRPGPFCALVVCNTVASAQHTAMLLAEEPAGDAEIFLIHARYRVGDRRARTDMVEKAFGKDRSARPERAVLVTTQVCEQSLDLSLDHVVTDLAPAAQIIQRAGRGLRHVLGKDVRVPVTVLVPTGSDGTPDDGRWRQIYGPALMRSTRELLVVHGPVAVPGDVQKLVDAVCAGWDADTLDRDVAAHLRGEQRMAEAALPVVIPHPDDLVDLFDLTDLSMTDAEAATRYDLDSVTVLPVWPQNGSLMLERRGGPKLSTTLPGDLTGVRERLLSVPRRVWVGELAQPPDAWQRDGRLGEVLLLVHPESDQPPVLAGWTVFYDDDLGLVTWPPVKQERS